MIWNGSKEKKRVKMYPSAAELKKKLFEYLRHLENYNQKKNFGATLFLVSFNRHQMHRPDLSAKSIQTGCVNVVGDWGIGKSVTGKLISK